MAELMDLGTLPTEQRNPASDNIDQVSTVELCRIINDQDATIAESVARCITEIAAAIDCLAARVRTGGRVIYVGAGTSGRLGVLDASEIPPTFSSPEGQFIGIIAGGEAAIRHAQEGAEDDVAAAIRDLEALQLNPSVDSLIGIAASGRTPYVLSCLSYAKNLGCATIGVACTEPSAMSASVELMISPVVGPEVVTGSTRMKAGTATKLVLNMLSTGTMIKIGKTYGNMMVDLKATNLKLQQRSRNILRTICSVSCPEPDSDLDILLQNCHGSVKLAIAALRLGVTPSEAKARLDEVGGVLANILDDNVILPPQSRDNQGYVLCIDGGGSKCAAAVMSIDGQMGYGESSGCNVMDVGTKSAMKSISSATQRACDALEVFRGKNWQPGHFSSIWVGLAGHDRKEVATSVDAALEKLFGRSQGSSLTITTDIELLAIPTAEKNNAESAIVLVAGTGSIAMSFKRQGQLFTRIGRSGGWGHLLGDDGSGFDIGRQAMRSVLALMDRLQFTRAHKQDVTLESLSHLQTVILDHFQPPGIAARDFNLLDAALSASKATEKKKRVAEVARLVVEASKVDIQAKGIVDHAAAALVRLLRPLASSGQVDPQESILILGGGLMRSEIFYSAIKQSFHDSGMVFQHIKVVENPAILGAELLWRKRHD